MKEKSEQHVPMIYFMARQVMPTPCGNGETTDVHVQSAGSGCTRGKTVKMRETAAASEAGVLGELPASGHEWMTQ
jgi:hypothetical protein